MSPSANKLLPPLPAGPKATLYTDLRTEHLDACQHWHSKYDIVVRVRDWHRIFKPIAKPLMSYKDKRLANLIQDRDRLLVKTDHLAARISEHCAWESAVAFAGVVREMLSTEPEEKGRLLTLWVMPEGSLQEQIEMLMDVRITMSLAIVLTDLATPDSEGVKMDWSFSFTQVDALIRRLTWLPMVQKHFDEIGKEQGAYRVVRLAGQDAAAFKQWLFEKYDPRSQRGKPSGTCTAALKHGKAWLIAVIAELLYLPAGAANAQQYIDKLAKSGAKGVEDEAAVERVQKQAVKDLQSNLNMEFRYWEFRPGLPANLVNEKVTYTPVSIAEAVKRLGPGSVNEALDPDDVAMMT